MADIFSSRSFSFDPNVLFKDSIMNDQVRSHLTKVYASLSLAIVCAALGSVAHYYYNIGGFITSIVTVFLMISLASDQNKNSPNRLLKFAAIGFFKGASIGPVINYAVYVDPSVIVTAFLGTTTIFVCFTFSALIAKRRSYMYLGGFLGSCLSLLFWGSLINIFFRSEFFMNAQLYVGLLVFCGYILYDTQMLLEKAHAGNDDYLMDAVNLFVNFIAIFVRLIIILLKNNQNNSRDRKRRN